MEAIDIFLWGEGGCYGTGTGRGELRYYYHECVTVTVTCLCVTVTVTRLASGRQRSGSLRDLT